MSGCYNLYDARRAYSIVLINSVDQTVSHATRIFPYVCDALSTFNNVSNHPYFTANA